MGLYKGNGLYPNDKVRDREIVQNAEDIKTTIGSIELSGLVFDTIADLQTSAILGVGDVIEILGYYTKGDGAGHKRIISLTDDGSGAEIGSLFANLVASSIISSSSFGAFSESKTDFQSQKLQRFLNYFKTSEHKSFSIDKYVISDVGLEVIYTTANDIKNKYLNGRIYFDINDATVTCLKIGVENNSYMNVSNKNFNLICSNLGLNCESVVKVYTEGYEKLALWASKFSFTIFGKKGIGLWVANGVFECVFDYIRSNLSKESDGVDTMEVGDVCLLLTNDAGNEILSSNKFGFVNTWGGYNGVVTEGLNGIYPPEFSATEVHIFDTKDKGFYLKNQGGQSIKLCHIEFCGAPSSWNGSGLIETIEGGGGAYDGINYPFLDVYNSGTGSFKLNNISTYSTPTEGYYNNAYPYNSKAIIEFPAEYKYSVSASSTGTIKSSTRSLIYDAGNYNGLLDSSNYSNLVNRGVANRLTGIGIDEDGIFTQYFPNNEDYDPNARISYAITINANASVPENIGIGFFGVAPQKKQNISGTTDAEKLESLISILQSNGLIG